MNEPFIFLCPEVTRGQARLLLAWLRDDEVTRYLSDGDRAWREIEQVLGRINLPDLTHLFNREGRFYLACARQGVPVGFVRLVRRGAALEIVVAIGDSVNWGKKLGAGTIRAAMKTAFFELRAPKMVAKIHRDNRRSLNAFISAGFTVEQEGPELHTLSITMEQYLQSIKGGRIMPTTLYLTELDRERLNKIIALARSGNQAPDDAMRRLAGEINKAVVVPSRQVPGDVITMNSRVLLEMNGQEIEVALAYPDEADWADKKMSVCSPVGTAILGYSEGQTVEWQVPSGTTEIHIKKILYQPEASGDYNL